VDPESVRMTMAALAALVGGGGIGWWLRGRYNWSRSVMLDELWTRKIKSFEESADQARASETRAVSARNVAEEHLVKEQQRGAELEQYAGGLEGEVEARRGDLRRERDKLEELERYAAELDVELRETRETSSADRTRLEGLERRLKNLSPYPGRLEECEAALARTEAQSAQEAEEKDAEIARLTDWIAELTPLSETLRRRGEELSAQRETEAELRLQLEERAGVVRELEQRHQRLRDEAEQRERVVEDQRRAEESLRARVAELETSLAGQAEDLVLQKQETIERSLKVTELEVELGRYRRELEALRAASRELERATEGSAPTKPGRSKSAKKKSTKKKSTKKKSTKKKTAAKKKAATKKKASKVRKRAATRPAEAGGTPPKDELKPKGSAPKKLPRRGADDLTAIKGIGPKVSAKLSAAGVRTYAQLAALEGQRLETLASEIEVPQLRIEREGWIPAAEKLAQVAAG